MTLKTHFLLQTVLYKQIRECWNKLPLKVNHASYTMGRLCTNQKCSVKDLAACEGLSPLLVNTCRLPIFYLWQLKIPKKCQKTLRALFKASAQFVHNGLS